MAPAPTTEAQYTAYKQVKIPRVVTNRPPHAHLYIFRAGCPLATLDVADRRRTALLDPLRFEGLHLVALWEFETSHLDT